MIEEEIEDAYPLSPAQSGMLYHLLEKPDSNVYVSYITIDILGELDEARLKKAWQDTIQRHSILRASFYWEGLDDPIQVINKGCDISWRSVNFIDTSEVDRQSKIAKILQGESRQGFDIQQAPLMRFTLVRSEAEKAILIWSIHHLLADGWSTPLILQDVYDNYSRQSGNAESDSGCDKQEVCVTEWPYRRYIQWLQSADQLMLQDYWNRRLHHIPLSNTRLRRVTNAQELPSETIVPQASITLGRSESTAISLFCRSHGITLGSLIHGAWSLVLRDYSAQNSVLFGTTVSGRPADLPQVDNAIGLFLTTLPLAVDIETDMTVIDWIRQLQLIMQQNAEHSGVSLVNLQKTLFSEEISKENRTIESIVVVESHAGDMLIGDADGKGIAFNNVQYQTHSHYPLALLAIPGESIEFRLVFDENRYYQNDVEAMLAYFTATLNLLAHNSHESLKQIHPGNPVHFLSIDQFRGKAPIPVSDHTVISLFEDTVQRHPDEIAVICSQKQLLRRELEFQSTQLACFLHDKQVTSGGYIGIMMDAGCEQVIALLGILKSGNGYIPLDVSSTVDQLAHIQQETGLSIILHDQVDRHNSFEHGVQWINIQNISEDTSNTAINTGMKNLPAVQSTNAAYLIYTSGSTGKPKGVMVNHSNVVYSTLARRDFYKEIKPRFLLLSPFTFDSSVAGMYWVLCIGGTLIIPETQAVKDPDHVIDIIKRHHVTHTLCLPSLYQLLLQFGNQDHFKSLKCVIVAGESCQPSVVEDHYLLLPKVELVNEYGPTEATVWSTAKRLSPTTDSILPIGKPIGDTLLLVLDAEGKPVPEGVEGEIYIGGKGVASGYINNPKKTETAFIKTLFSGNCSQGSYSENLYRSGDLGYYLNNGDIVFTGRADRQLKIRGFRVEPGQIESALSTHPHVREIVVVGQMPSTDIGDEAVNSKSTQSVLEEIEKQLASMPYEDVIKIFNELGITNENLDLDTQEST